MTDLSVEVRYHGVVINQPGTGRCVTYRQEPNSPLLEAVCSMRSDPDPETLHFFLTGREGSLRQGEGTRLASTKCI